MDGADVGSSIGLENRGDLRVNGSMPSPSAFIIAGRSSDPAGLISRSSVERYHDPQPE